MCAELRAFVVCADMHDIWVGGHRQDGWWQWVHTGQDIPLMDGSLPWSSGNIRDGHDCLSVYRDNYNQPLLVAHPCDQLHSFVCEEAYNLWNTSVKEVRFKSNSYRFLNERLTWSEAYELCASNDFILPVVTDMDTASFLARAGPGYQDLWLGGRVQEGRWVWKPWDRRIDASHDDDGGYPTWVQPRRRPFHDCLSLYRDNGDTPLLADRLCNETLPVVCQACECPSCLLLSKLCPLLTLVVFRTRSLEKKHIHGKHESRWLDRESNPGISGCESRVSPLFQHAHCYIVVESVHRRFSSHYHVFPADSYLLGDELETFDLGNRHFTFVRKPETWSEAADICGRNGSFLPIVSSPALMQLIAQKTSGE
ncbi:hypothetical protein PR048_028551 [Dryococelus australis]|uniref:C-type lectin domain-containing protein n=1 Tax=Dryococelus australis TaxID=614101 RepID=A0ABQ9GAW5_9NEOP|nr:hypothetical protein PR048_028551 [Dryococelus australis]